MKLSEVLKTYRKENDLSQREFAKKCGLSNSLISILEMGKNPQTGKAIDPDMRTYRRIAEGMGITVDKLFSRISEDAVKGTPGMVTVEVPQPDKPNRRYAQDSLPKTLETTRRFGVETAALDPKKMFPIGLGDSIPVSAEVIPEKATKLLKVVGELAKDDPESAADLLKVLVDRGMI